MIEDIMASRKLEAEYKKRDEEERQRHLKDHLRVNGEESGEEKGVCGSSNDGHEGPSRQDFKNKPWRSAKKDDDLDDRLNTLVSPLQPHSSTAEGGEEQTSDQSTLVEDGGRGYRRYRTNIHGKNKTRPWRDDTNVFDAY